MGYKGLGHDYVAGWVYISAVFGENVSPPAGLTGAAIGGIIAQKSLERTFDILDGVDD